MTPALLSGLFTADGPDHANQGAEQDEDYIYPEDIIIAAKAQS